MDRQPLGMAGCVEMDGELLGMVGGGGMDRELLDHRKAGGPEGPSRCPQSRVDVTVVHGFMSGAHERGRGERCLSASVAEVWLFSSL